MLASPRTRLATQSSTNSVRVASSVVSSIVCSFAAG
jgi:hypothetical protein